MLKKKISIKKFVTLFALVFAFSTIFFTFGNKIYASYGNLPDQLPTRYGDVSTPDDHQYINLSNRDTEAQGADAESSWIKIYNDPAAQDVTVYLNLTDRRANHQISCEGYSIQAIVWYLDGNENQTGASVGNRFVQNRATGNRFVDRCTGDNNYSGYEFTIRSSEMTWSNVEGHDNMYVGLVQLMIVPNNINDSKSASFQLTSPTGTRLGYAGNPGNIDKAITVYPSLRRSIDGPSYPVPDNPGPPDPPPYPVHTISHKFGVPCNDNSGSFRFRWKDDDQSANSSTQNNPNSTTLRIKVVEYNGGAVQRVFSTAPTPGQILISPTPGWTGDADSRSYIEITGAQAGFNYRVEFENVRGGNGIPFYYPYDSGNYNLDCNPPSAADNSCSQIKFTIGANRLYRVWVNDGGSIGNPDFNYMNANPLTSDFSGTTPASGEVTIDLLGPNKIVSGDLQYTVADVRNVPGVGNRYVNINPIVPPSTEPPPSTVTNCYRASCKITNVSGSGYLSKGSNYYNVKANESIDVEIEFKNEGSNRIGPTLNTGSGSYPLATTLIGANNIPGLAQQSFGFRSFDPGASDKKTFSVNAPNDISNSHTMNYYPDFAGWGRIGADCGTALHTYKYFDHDLSPTMAITSIDLENPQTIDYGGSIDETPSGVPVVRGTATYKLIKNGSTLDGPFDVADDYGDKTLPGKSWADGNITTPEFVAGDKVCSFISLTNKSGYVGAGGPTDVIGGTPGDSGESGCQTVYNLPFVRSYQGDVISGGRFGANGLIGDGTVAGTIRSSHAGSGSEFGAITGGIFYGGFASAMLRDLSGSELPIPDKGLTFANSPGATRGQYYANSQRQVVDYFKDTKKADTPVTPPTPILTIGSTPNGQTWLKGNVTLNGDTVIPTGARHTVYVEGNVTINGNIDYGAFTSPETIPYFSLIVKGNIYITKNVSRLDGRYIAQPTGANNADVNSGIIYTCTDTNGDRFSTAALYDNCNDNKLTVNGSLMAQKIKFLRTKGTLRDIPISVSGGATSLRYALYIKANGPTPRTFAGRINFPTAPASTTISYTPTPTGPSPQITSGCADLGSIFSLGVTSSFELCYWNATGGTVTGNTQPQIVLDSDPTPAGKTCRTVNILVTPNKKLCVASNAWGSTTGYEQLRYGSDKIAEEIRLTPEFLIGDPAYKPKPKGEPINGQYDSIVTLPPIL